MLVLYQNFLTTLPVISLFILDKGILTMGTGFITHDENGKKCGKPCGLFILEKSRQNTSYVVT